MMFKWWSQGLNAEKQLNTSHVTKSHWRTARCQDQVTKCHWSKGKSADGTMRAVEPKGKTVKETEIYTHNSQQSPRVTDCVSCHGRLQWPVAPKHPQNCCCERLVLRGPRQSGESSPGFAHDRWANATDETWDQTCVLQAVWAPVHPSHEGKSRIRPKRKPVGQLQLFCRRPPDLAHPQPKTCHGLKRGKRWCSHHMACPLGFSTQFQGRRAPKTRETQLQEESRQGRDALSESSPQRCSSWIRRRTGPDRWPSQLCHVGARGDASGFTKPQVGNLKIVQRPSSYSTSRTCGSSNITHVRARSHTVFQLPVVNKAVTTRAISKRPQVCWTVTNPSHSCQKKHGTNAMKIRGWSSLICVSSSKCVYMCVKLRVHFGSILGPFWVHFGSILGPFWVHFGSILGPFWVHFGSILGPFWVHFGSILGPFGVHFGSILGPFWVHMGSIWGPLWSIMVHFAYFLSGDVQHLNKNRYLDKNQCSDKNQCLDKNTL